MNPFTIARLAPPPPPLDAVLIASLVSAVRQMQTDVDRLDGEVRRLKNKVGFLEGGFEP